MRVGVILAARAPVPYLAEALESVMAQEPPPAAIVVVDHGSEPPLELPLAGTDPLGADAPRAHPAGTDPAHSPVGIIRADPGGGPAAARQAGLRAVDTDLIAIADADDVWEPGKLAAQLAALASHPAAAVCFGRATVIDADGRPTGERLPELPEGLVADAGRVLYERNPIPAASALIRREPLELAGGFIPDEPLPAASDWDLWLRLAAAGCEFVCAPEARIRYRRHAGGLSSNLSRLAAAGLAIHERHADLADDDTARAARAADLVTLAKGQIRDRRYGDARRTLAAAGDLRRLTPKERATRTTAAVPLLRRALGCRDPYRTRGRGLPPFTPV